MDAKRYPEAAIFCRTYCPNKLSVAIDKWNELIEKEVGLPKEFQDFLDTLN